VRIAIVAVLLVVVCSSAAAAVRRPPALVESCLTKSERARAVAFRASDGIRLKGVVLGRGTTGVVLVHELRRDLCSWLPFARVLAQRGYLVLDFDARNFGSSQRVNSAASFAVDRDVRAAVAVLRSRGANRIVLGGASMGGTAVLAAGAALRPQPAAVLSLSGPASFASMDALAAVRKLRAPTLFLAGKDDTQFAEDARAMFEASVSPRKRLELRDTGAHGTDLLRGAGGAEVRALALAFVAGD
jgi:pimeloyl-ACP methyl ester carboxylesterase